MIIRTLAAACGAALLSQFAISANAFAADAAQSHWVTAWATALQPIPQRENLPPLYRAPEVNGRTVRQIIYPTLSGKSVRIHLSNEYGKTPLVVQEMRLARSSGGAAAGSGERVTFGGKSGVTVAPGGETDSDPVTFEVAAGAPYAVSAFMGNEQRIAAWHRVANQVNYVSAPGDHAADASGDAFRGRFTQYVWMTGMTVEAAAPSATVAAIGDSITDGMRSSLDQNRRWPDAYARRLAASGEGRSVAVVNLGISGNRLLSDSPCYGDALATRFEHDVLRRPGVKAVVVLIGINDINFAAMPAHAGLDCDFPHTTVTAADLIAGYQRLVAEARHAGVKLFGATLTPASLPPTRESTRLAVNQWIRTSHAFDGVVDFDAALRDPAKPDRLQRQFDSGDHIHPSDVGYAAMAAAVPEAVVNSTRK